MLQTPEQIDKMYPNEGEDFETLLNLEQVDDSNLREGKIVKISDDSVMIDIQEKKEGRININEIKDNAGNLLYKVDDSILVYVSKKGALRISHKIALRLQKIRDTIKSLVEDFKDRVVEGKIIKKNRGGFIVESADGVEYFMPKRDSALREDINKTYIGKNIKACVVDVRPNDNSILISRKRFLDTNLITQKENAKKLLETGLAYEGIVKGVTKFGVFVEIGGSVEGLVHATEISYKGHVNPLKMYEVGDTVQVKPLEYQEKNNRLSLSIRALFDDPWKEIKNEIKVGYVIRVVVSNLESYGAFVDLGNEVEGFLHISEMSWDKNIKQPSDYLKVGDEINVEVIEIDADNRKLRVSLKKLQDKPFDKFAKIHKVGDIVKGKVTTTTNFGAFVNLGGVDGLFDIESAFCAKSKKAIN